MECSKIIGAIMTIKDDMMQLAWIYLGTGIAAYIIWIIRDNAFQSGYWKGRKQGWDMHRRMINTQRTTDEVFDYDKQN